MSDALKELLARYGIRSDVELSDAIRDMTPLDITVFCGKENSCGESD